MQVLITFFFELCALRRSPQELPASELLFAVLLLADLAVGLMVGITAGLGWWMSLVQGMAEIALMLGALYVALNVLKLPGRFLQAGAALLGSGALIGLVALLPLGLDPTSTRETDLAAFGALMFLALVIWSIVVTGHILRHTFDITLGQGAAVAVAFEVFAVALIGTLLGGG